MKASPRRSRPPGTIGDGTRVEDRRLGMSEAVGGCRAGGAAGLRLSRAATRVVVALLVVSAGIGLPLKAIAPAASAATRAANLGLPDSVMASVGTRSITVPEFWRTWRETHPGAATDTLTPQSARGFLEILIDRELISAAAERERWTWSAADSTSYAAGVDRITLGAALEAALAEARTASGDSAASLETVGVLARERAMSTLAPRFEDPALEQLARAFAAIPRPVSDSSLAAQLRMLAAVPMLEPADRMTVIARTPEAGAVTVDDVVTPWARLSPAYRPRIETAAQVRDLAENVLFERWLRKRAAGYAGDPKVARILERERELIDVQHLMAERVHAIEAPSRAVLERYRSEHAALWIVPARWRVIRLEAAELSAATRLALLLRDPVAAESLVTRAAREGVRYRLEIRAAGDSGLFARATAAGPGTVLGPDAEGLGWTVTRIEALIPAREPPWEEVRARVQERWYADESARRLSDLLARERRRQRVRVGAVDPASTSACSED